MEEFSRKSEWRSLHGEVVAFEDMEDSHLMNVFAYVSTAPRFERIGTKDGLVEVLSALIKERGLNPTGESEPYKKDGLWYYFNEETKQHMQIVGERKLNKEICKLCRSKKVKRWQRLWNENDDKMWKEKEIVMCYLEDDKFQKEEVKTELPTNCPYKLEQLVIGDSNG